MNSLRIKYIPVILFFLMTHLAGIAQKVNVQVIKTAKAGLAEWQILDGQYRQVVSGNDFFREDTISFSLEAGNRYLLQVSILEIYQDNAALCSLWLNGAPLLLVNTDAGIGDHFYPFFTGVRTEGDKIIGGTDANIAEFPWQVYYTSGSYLCGGTVISANWVMTAAHCTKNKDGSNIPVSEMLVKAGATNPFDRNQGEEYRVSEVIVHESFNRQTLSNDIALLRLSVPIDVQNAEPIKLVTDADKEEGATDPGVISWVTGWGLTKVSPEVFPVNLQKVQMPIVSNAQASIVWGVIPSNILMAGYRDGNKDACNGDSGGPMVVQVSGEYRLAGITSWGSENCNTYSGFTEVSAFGTWIRTKTGITEYAPPVPSGDALVCGGVVSGTYSIEPQPGVSEYEWQLYPEGAGVIAGNSESADVTWNSKYFGEATVKLRVTIDNKLSEWSRRYVDIARNTKIISQPEDMVLCAGQTINLDIDAEGHNLRYNWYKNGVFANSFLTGNYSISNASTGHSGEYMCEIAGSCGTLNTEVIDVTVHPVTVISSLSPDITVNFGDDVTLEVIADGHALNYKWEKNDEIIEDASTSILALMNADAGDIGLYRATVTGTCGTEISGRSYVYVRKEEASKDPEVFLWPTITRGEINVALSTDDSYNISIFSSSGEIIRELKNCRYQTTVHVDNYARGLYIISVYNSKLRKNQKFIKE